MSWSSSNTHIATIDPLGRVRAAESGFTTIRALIDGVAAEAQVQVRPPDVPVGHVLVRPQQRGTWVGQAVSYAETLAILDAAGRPLSGRPVSWLVQDTSIARVDSAGVVRGVRPGTTRVRATSGGVHGLATVVVYAVPGDDATYDLTYDWWDGEWHMAPQAGTDTWTDSTGVQHAVNLFVARGTLTFGRDGLHTRYTREVVLEGYAVVAGAARRVIERTLTDRGLVTIMVGGETGDRMISNTTPGDEWHVLGTNNAGHLMMRAAIGAAPVTEYMLRLRP